MTAPTWKSGFPRPRLGVLLFLLCSKGQWTYAYGLGIEPGLSCVTVAFLGMFSYSVNSNPFRG